MQQWLISRLEKHRYEANTHIFPLSAMVGRGLGPKVIMGMAWSRSCCNLVVAGSAVLGRLQWGTSL
jgi:hypothetical protein